MADVEDISTDTMRTTTGRPAALVRQATQTLQTTAAGTKAQYAQLFCWMLVYTFPSLWALTAFYSVDADNALCDSPIANWLWVYGAFGIFLGALAVYTRITQLSIQPVLEAAKALPPESPEAQEVLRPAAGKIALLTALGCCCQLPLGIFMLVWYIKGNFDVWGTHAAADITRERIGAVLLATGEARGYGCDPALWHAAKNLLVYTYVTLACACCLTCGAFGVGLAYAAGVASSQQAAQAAQQQQGQGQGRTALV